MTNMSTEDQLRGNVEVDVAELPKPATEQRKRPRLDLSAVTGGTRERKRGKSMFGLVLGTLNKAKIEDKERNASEAAKKRQLTEKRLQTKLRNETDSVRRAEEAKKSKNAANRKEEDLQLKDSIYKTRWRRFPVIANFLLTSDTILDDSSMSSVNPLSFPPRSHPPPLYYLPAKLTPAQESFLARRKQEVKEAVDKEWEMFKDERTAGVEEINRLRQQAIEEEAKVKSERVVKETDSEGQPSAIEEKLPSPPIEERHASIDADEAANGKEEESGFNISAKKEESISNHADDDEAVEY